MLTNTRRREARANLPWASASFSDNLAIFLVFSLAPALFTLRPGLFPWDPFSCRSSSGWEFHPVVQRLAILVLPVQHPGLPPGLPLSMAGNRLGLALLDDSQAARITLYRTVFLPADHHQRGGLFLCGR